MKRWHTYNRKKKRHTPKEVWRFQKAAKRVLANQNADLGWQLFHALTSAIDDVAISPRPDRERRQMITEAVEGFRGSMVNAVLAKTHWDIIYTEIGKEQLTLLDRHLNP